MGEMGVQGGNTGKAKQGQLAEPGVALNVDEWMKGYVGFGATDCEEGAEQGLEEDTRFEHGVTIRMDDIDRFVAEGKHAATMDGYVECARLGGKCEFTGGVFNMLVDSFDPFVKYMFYRIPFVNGHGQQYTMLGHKTLRDDRGADLWSDITTLEIRIFEGHEVEGPTMLTPAMGPPEEWKQPPIAMGVLRIEFWDGVKSALSFDAPGASRYQTAIAVKKFCAFYGSRVWDLFAALRPREVRASDWTMTEAHRATQKRAPVKWLLAGDLLRRATKIARSMLGNELDLRDWMTHDRAIDLRYGLHGRVRPRREVKPRAGQSGVVANGAASGNGAVANGAARENGNARADAAGPARSVGEVTKRNGEVDHDTHGAMEAAAATAAGNGKGTAHDVELDEIWFDYIADTGDDPNVMQALAVLIGKRFDPDTLELGDGVRKPDEALEVGPFVFVGGDTAYHVADETTLRRRFVEPFERALGVTDENRQTFHAEQERHLFGIPGNHDYYDNLVGFNRMFRRPFHQRDGVLQIPGYELRQESSYVKILLPGDWQLWGADLANGLDYRQWRYFGEVPKKLILCVATPPVTFDEVRVSTDVEDDEHKAYRRLFGVRDDDALVFEPPKVAAKLKPGACRLHIAGDEHHYVRYDDGKQPASCAVSIVSGGGGAFLHPTETSRGDVKRAKSYPTVETSRELSSQLSNPAVVMAAGGVYLVGALLAMLLYWTFPRSTLKLASAGLWVGALAVMGGSLYAAYALTTRMARARKRRAKAKRKTVEYDPAATAKDRAASMASETAERVRPLPWIIAIALALAAPYLARQLEDGVDPLSRDAAFLVLGAVMTLALALLARSRGMNLGFGVLHAIASLGLPISIALAGTTIGIPIVVALWLVFYMAAPRLYQRELKWPLAVLWFVQGPSATAGLWILHHYGIGERVFPDALWMLVVVAIIGLFVTSAQFGWYLLVASAFGAHNNEVGAAVLTTDYKQWIRFHVTRDECIGYVIAVERPLIDPRPKLVDVFRVRPKQADAATTPHQVT